MPPRRRATCGASQCERAHKAKAGREWHRAYVREHGQAYVGRYRERYREHTRAYQATRVTARCDVCMTEYELRRDSTYDARSKRRVCSMACVRAAYTGKWPQSEVPAHHPVRSTELPLDHPARQGECQGCGETFPRMSASQVRCRRKCGGAQRGRMVDGAWVLDGPRFVASECRRCSSPFLVDRLPVWGSTIAHHYCSTRCSTADHRAIRRARQRDAYVEPVHRQRVFERDGWRCQLCDRKVRRDAVVPHPLAPTLDHIIPLALGPEAGGVHSMANVQLAHYRCNCRKSARGGGEQLALLG